MLSRYEERKYKYGNSVHISKIKYIYDNVILHIFNQQKKGKKNTYHLKIKHFSSMRGERNFKYERILYHFANITNFIHIFPRICLYISIYIYIITSHGNTSDIGYSYK